MAIRGLTGGGRTPVTGLSLTLSENRSPARDEKRSIDIAASSSRPHRQSVSLRKQEANSNLGCLFCLFSPVCLPSVIIEAET